jgi:hypothetical protein
MTSHARDMHCEPAMAHLKAGTELSGATLTSSSRSQSLNPSHPPPAFRRPKLGQKVVPHPRAWYRPREGSERLRAVQTAPRSAGRCSRSLWLKLTIQVSVGHVEKTCARGSETKGHDSCENNGPVAHVETAKFSNQDLVGLAST